MAALTEQERQLLGAAAVLGATPDWDLVPRIAGMEPADAVVGLRHVRNDLVLRHGQHLDSALLESGERLLIHDGSLVSGLGHWIVC